MYYSMLEKNNIPTSKDESASAQKSISIISSMGFRGLYGTVNNFFHDSLQGVYNMFS